MRNARPPQRKIRHPGVAERTTKNGERVYVAIWRDADGRQREQVCRDEKAGKPLNLLHAQQFRNRQLVAPEKRSARVERSPNPRLVSYFARWRTTFQGGTRNAVRSDTRFDYASYIELHAMPLVDNLRVTEIKPRHLRELADAIRTYADDPTKRLAGRARSYKTVSNRCAAFKVLVACAAEDAGIPNPLFAARIANPTPQIPFERAGDLERVGLIEGKNGVGALTFSRLAWLSAP